MAGERDVKSLSREINKWYLDYLCKITWEDFKETKCISDGKRDLIQGMLSEVGSENIYKDKQLFLVTLCRLADGQDCDTRYSENSNVTVLEDTLVRFEALVNLQKKDLQTEGLELLPVIKAEAVLVCCRENEFELAQEVCDRLWLKKDRKDKMLMNIQDLLRHGKTDPKYLDEYKYEDFLNTMLKYLDKVQQQFETPMLFEAVRCLMKVTNMNGNSEVDGTDRSNNAGTVIQFSSALVEKAREKKGGKVATPERQLKKLWNATTTEIFGGSTQNENNQKGLPETNERRIHSETERTPNQKRVLPDSQTPKSNSRTPAKSRRIMNSEDNQEPSSSKAHHSPRYRKNIDRENRHEPVKTSSSSEISDVEDDDNGDNGYTSIFKTSIQRRSKWTEDEMESFYDAVKMFGVGKWADIKEHLGTSRSGVQLKDKWRNMLKSGDVGAIEKKRKK